VTIRAVTVDLWGTLLHDPPVADDRHKSRRLADFTRILEAAGVPVVAERLDRAYQDSAVFLGQIWMQNRDVPVAQHVRAILLGLEGDVPRRLSAETQQALVDAYSRAAMLAPPAAAEGARPALAALARRGYTLCLVSNTMRTPGVVLREILKHYGLLDFFAHLTFSDECGIRKPEPEIFHRTLRAAKAAPSDAIHVGDDPVLDVEGARAAGMRVIQLTTGRAPWFGARRPHATIATLAALPEAVAKLEQRRGRGARR
jgi:putative hydrolase of the HAD superfamily